MENMIRNYELAFILKKEDVTPVFQLLKQQGLTITNEGTLQKIDLAYPIQKLKTGYFGYLQFEGKPDLIGQLRAKLIKCPEVLRFLIIKKLGLIQEMKTSQSAPGKSRLEFERKILTNEAIEDEIRKMSE